MNQPKVSIITVCYNAQNTIEHTLRSVNAQSYPSIEHIIIDGGSTDQTLPILQSLKGANTRIQSEPDEGIYDAFHKGFSLSSGDIIGFLNADDCFAHNEVVANLVKTFVDTQTDAVASSVEIFKSYTPLKRYRLYKASDFKLWQFRLGMQPPHPGFYVTRSAFEQVGFYRTQYQISGDFDWLLRAIKIQQLKVVYLPDVSVNMLHGGASASGLKSKRLMNKEDLKILKQHGIYSHTVLIWLKYVLKVFQFRF